MSQAMGIVFVALLATVGVGCAFVAYSRRHDRPVGEILLWLAAAGFFLLVPSALLSEALAIGLLYSLVFALPAIALVAEWRRGRDRRQARDLAIAAGVDPHQARRDYRRRRRSPVVIMLMYMGVAFVWMLSAGAAAFLSGASTSTPAWAVPTGVGQMMEVSWWLAVTAIVVCGGLVHATFNAMRS